MKTKFKYLKVNSNSAKLFIQYAGWRSTTLTKLDSLKDIFLENIFGIAELRYLSI